MNMESTCGMSPHAYTLVVMGRRKKASQPEPDMSPPKKRPRKGTALTLWIDDRLAGALTAYLNSLRPKPTRTAAVSVALEEFLARVGFWPPPPPA